MVGYLFSFQRACRGFNLCPHTNQMNKITPFFLTKIRLKRPPSPCHVPLQQATIQFQKKLLNIRLKGLPVWLALPALLSAYRTKMAL